MRPFVPTSFASRRPPLALLAATVFLLVTACAQPTIGGMKNEYRRQSAALPERPHWIDSVPADAEGSHFLVGLSEYHASERDAREDAMRHAREQYAEYTGVDVALVDTVVRSLHGVSSEVHDPFVDAVEKTTQSTDAQVSRIKARQWYWETYGHYNDGEIVNTAYKCWVLVSVPIDEYDRVQAWKKSREESRLAEETRRARMIEDFAKSTAAEAGEKVTSVLLPTRSLAAVLDAARREGNEAALLGTMEKLDAQLAANLRLMLPFPVSAAAAPSGIWQIFSPEELAQLRATGARYALRPRIDSFADLTAQKDYPRFARMAQERRISLAAAVEVVDLASGEIVPASASLQLDRNESSGMVAPGTPVRLERVPFEIAKEMAFRLARATAVAVGPPRILSITGEQILIDRGGAFGLKAGETVALFAARTSRAAGSGQAYSEELPVGKARIVRVDETRAYALLLPPVATVLPGFVVRPIAGEEGKATVATDDYETPGSSDKPVNWNVNLK